MEELIAKYLANELGTEERVEFEKQLVENEELSNALQEQLNLWEITFPSDASFGEDQAWEKVAPSIAPTRKSKVVRLERKPNYTFLKIAATLLIVLMAGYLISNYSDLSLDVNFGSDSLTEVSTKAEIKEVELPDGSIVRLNGHSSITYAEGFGVEHRNIELVGQAIFDVERNEEIPFLIQAENGLVEVLGTSFNVRAYAGSPVELNVSEGEVKFSSSDNEKANEILKAGDRAVLTEDGNAIEKGKVTDRNLSSWWTRELSFEQTPFSDVVKALENTYWVEIDYSRVLRNCPLNASYDHLELSQVLELIQSTFAESEIKVSSVKENHIKLEGKACAN